MAPIAAVTNEGVAVRTDTERRRELLRKVRRIEITTQRTVRNYLAGAYHSVFKGQGIEFDRVRPYEAGDDVRTIDRNVTARVGRPHVKIFHEERELTVMLLVDVSKSMDFGMRRQRKTELAAELAALLAFSAIRNQDKVGCILFSDRVERVILPDKGRRHVLRVVSEILAFEPDHPGTSVGTALAYLSRLKIRQAVTFVISDFLDSGYEAPLRVANKKHELTAFVVRDPVEHHVPALGLTTIADPETGASLLLDLGTREGREWLAGRFGALDAERERVFRKYSVRSLRFSTDTRREPYAASLVAFFRRGAGRA